MKTNQIIGLILMTAVFGYVIGGFTGVAVGKIHYANRYANTPLKPLVKPDTAMNDSFTVYRSSENGKDIVYSVTLPDTTGYDFLSLTELDSVLSGYQID